MVKVLVQNREPHYDQFECKYTTLTDVYAFQDGKKIFIEAFNLKSWQLEEMKKLIITLHKAKKISTHKFYGHTKTPLQFVHWMKENNYTFDTVYSDKLRCQKSMAELIYYPKANFWDFHGNLKQISAAFHFRIFEKRYAETLAKFLVGMNIIIDLEGVA
jgi:hypothetical protein